MVSGLNYAISKEFTCLEIQDIWTDWPDKCDCCVYESVYK